jgi:hypothetical protein
VTGAADWRRSNSDFDIFIEFLLHDLVQLEWLPWFVSGDNVKQLLLPGVLYKKHSPRLGQYVELLPQLPLPLP